MPHLAPGVYIEENGFLPRSIQRAPTSAAVFVGPTLKGPIGGHAGSASPLTSYPDFERTYGRPAEDGLSPGTVSALQAFALSVRAFSVKADRGCMYRECQAKTLLSLAMCKRWPRPRPSKTPPSW